MPIIEAAVEDVLNQDMYEVPFTLLRIFSAFRKFGAPDTCELGNCHPPFCAKQLRQALTPQFISDDVVLRRIFGNQLDYYRQAADWTDWGRHLAGLVLAAGEVVAPNQSAVLTDILSEQPRSMAAGGAQTLSFKVPSNFPCSLAENSLFRKKYSLFERVGNFTLSQRIHCTNPATQAATRDRIGKIPS